MEAISGVAVAIVGGIGYLIKNKYQYKVEKWNIYKKIKEGIDNSDFNILNEGIKLLKEFDIRYSDKLGNPIRGVFEKLRCYKRLKKMDKIMEKFGLDLDDIIDLESIKNWVDKNKNDINKINKELNTIQEEEIKEQNINENTKKQLEKIKGKVLLKNNINRNIIDKLNLTEIINDIHKQYETLLIEEMEKKIDIKSILQRNMKKQIIKQ